MRISQVLNKEGMDRSLRTLAANANKRYGGLGEYNVEDEIKKFDVSL